MWLEPGPRGGGGGSEDGMGKAGLWGERTCPLCGHPGGTETHDGTPGWHSECLEVAMEEARLGALSDDFDWRNR